MKHNRGAELLQCTFGPERPVILERVLVARLLEELTRRDDEDDIADCDAPISGREVLEHVRSDHEVVSASVADQCFEHLVRFAHHEAVVDRALKIPDVGLITLDPVNRHLLTPRPWMPRNVAILSGKETHSSPADADVEHGRWLKPLDEAGDGCEAIGEPCRQR